MKARQRLLLFTVFFLSLLPFCSRAEEAPITEEAFFNLAMGEGKNYSESEEKKLLQGLEQGYSVNARGGSRTVFMQIVRRASTPDLVRAALKSKPDLNARDYAGKTPFLIAISEKPLETAELLWPSPFPRDARDSKGETPVTMAMRNPDPRVLPRILKESVDARAKDASGISPLLRIARGDLKADPSVPALLKARGADFNETDPETGWTTLQTLFLKGKDIRFGNEEKQNVLRFLRLGASPDAQNKLGDTAFHALLRQPKGNFCPPFRMLMAAKPNIEIKDRQGATVLNALARTARDDSGRRDLAWELLAAGADINAPDNDGITPLMAAAESASKDVTYALLLAGADARAVSKEGLNVLFYGISGHLNMDAFRELIRSGADVNHRHAPTGMTPLLAGLLDGSTPDYAWYLIEGGAEVNAADIEGRTPLMAAALRQDYGRLFDKLLEAGADISAKDKQGKKALDYLALNPKFADPGEKTQKNLAGIREKLSPSRPQAQ